MKASRFNVFTEYGNGDTLAFNTLTGGLVKLDNDVYTTYQRLVSDNIDERPDTSDPVVSAIVSDLEKGGFLVDDRFDELGYLKIFVEKSKYQYGNTLGLTIAVTTACNFKCVYCYEDGIKFQSMPIQVEEKLIAYAEKNLKQKGIFSVTWYGGEPLLALDTIRRLSDAFLDITSKKEAKYSAGIITNGFLLDREVAMDLVKRKVSFAQITVDGGMEDHNRNRPLRNGEGTFDTIMNNIKEVADILPINIRVNIGKNNIESFSKLLDEFDRQNISHKIMSLTPAILEIFEFSPQNVKDAELTSEEFSKITLNMVQMALDRGINAMINQGRAHISCCSIRPDSFVVGPDGSLYKCWDMIGREEEIVGTIDKNVRLRDGSAKWLAWDCFRDEGCRNCKILPLCLGGCPRKWIMSDCSLNVNSRCEKIKYNLSEWVKLMYRQHKTIRNQVLERGV